MAVPVYGQWVCHSPNVMKTDIFAVSECSESGKSTQGSIRFDSLYGSLVRPGRLACHTIEEQDLVAVTMDRAVLVKTAIRQY
jgi:hypothetical protein